MRYITSIYRTTKSPSKGILGILFPLLVLLPILLNLFMQRDLRAQQVERIQSVYIHRGEIRVWQKPSYRSEKRGVITKVGRFPVKRVLPPGGKCNHRWFKLGPKAYACSGWLIPSSYPPTKLPQLKHQRPQNTRVVGRKRRTLFYKSIDHIKRERPQIIRGLTGFGVIGRRVFKEHIYLETMGNGWVPQVGVRQAPSTSLVGVTLERQSFLPLAFVTERGTRIWRLYNGRAHPSRRILPQYTVRRVFGKTKVQEQCFVRIGNGGGLSCDTVKIATQPPPPPKDISEKERWLDLDSKNAILYGRKGSQVERVMLVSLSPKTPVGQFRIQSKHISMTLHNQNQLRPWYLEQVPYVMFFHKTFAFHTAYWHDEFGTVSTQGCVNLSPTDGRWVFDFVNPQLPSGYILINSTENDRGSLVRIHKP